MPEGSFTLKLRGRVNGSLVQGEDIQDSSDPCRGGGPWRDGRLRALAGQSWNLLAWLQVIFCSDRGSHLEGKRRGVEGRMQLSSTFCSAPDLNNGVNRPQHSWFSPEQGWAMCTQPPSHKQLSVGRESSAEPRHPSAPTHPQGGGQWGQVWGAQMFIAASKRSGRRWASQFKRIWEFPMWLSRNEPN